MADFDKAFGKTGAGNEEEMNRKKDLKELTSVFSKKNIFGKEKPAEEATQAAILEQNKNVESAIQTLPNQEQLLKDIADVFKSQKNEAAENAFEEEQDRLETNKILQKTAEDTAETAENSETQAKESKNRGSMLGKMGGALAGAGIAAAGLGVALFASAKALKEFEAVNMEKVSGNVKEILEIVPKADGEGALLSFFAEGGTLALVLGGLGIGLGVFGVGSAAAAAATEFVGFEAETVKNNVLTLLSINDAAGGNFDFLIDSAFFAAAMTGIAAGLAVFGAGALVSSLGVGAAEGVNKFSSDEKFADTIKANVLTLLSLDEAVGGKANLIGESAVFLVAMTTIASGLALFGAGAAVASLGQGAAEGIAHFSGDGGFAEQIKQNVITLLSIDDAIEANGENFLGEGAKFFLAMSTIAGGLALYGAGSAVAGIGSGLANFMSKEGDFAKDISDKVTTLLSIGDGRTDLKGDADAVEYALKRIGSGISSFGSDSFSNALSNFGTGFVEFFTIGGDKPTPLDIAMKVADKGPSLKAGAEGMGILANAFNRLASVSSNNDFKMHPDAINNLTAFSYAMDTFAGAQYDMSSLLGDNIPEGMDTMYGSGIDRTKPIVQVANAFHALADGMDRVSDSARNLQAPGVIQGLELYSSGAAAGMGSPVIINQISNAPVTVTSAPTTVVGIEAEGRQLSNAATNSD